MWDDVHVYRMDGLKAVSSLTSSEHKYGCPTSSSATYVNTSDKDTLNKSLPRVFASRMCNSPLGVRTILSGNTMRDTGRENRE